MEHRVLCIDDETHNLEALERLLRKKYLVTCVNSGPLGLEEVKKHKFSIIISDQKMPEMTGVEFFMEAKKQQPDAIRILLTGYTDLESVINAINQGQIYRYITKPWDPEELLGIVNQALEVFEMKGTILRQNQELQTANERLQSLDKLKTDFMLLVNHELKTPLTGIFSFVQLLGEEKLSSEQHLYIDKIAKNTRRLQDLINDTLLITRIKTNLASVEKNEVNIKSLIEGQWTELKKDFASKNLTLKLKPEGGFSQIANEKYIRIVVKKFLHNCFIHAKSSTTVEINMESQEQGWTISILNELSKDIDKNLDELIGAFTRSENILNHSGGSGLGLAVIQAIVHLFAGSLEITNENKQFQLKLHFPISD